MEKENLIRIYNEFIDTLIKNQNNNPTTYFQNLCSKQGYDWMLKPVLEIVQLNPEASYEELHSYLLEKSNITEEIKRIVYKKRLTPGLVTYFGTELTKDKIICGNRQEVIFNNGSFQENFLPMENDTIFDLASTSKLFTSVSILKLCEAGLIHMEDEIGKYLPEYEGIKDVTIFDLITFRVPVKTTQRIDSQKTVEDAQEALKTLYVDPNPFYFYPYTDMGAMLLKVLIEKVTNMKYDDFVKEEIFDKVGLSSTFLNVPMDLVSSVANENYSSIARSNGSLFTRFDNIPGTPHDTKSIAIGHSTGNAPGHAGYFSNMDDMMKLSTALYQHKILNPDDTNLIGTNFMGYYDEKEENYSCHHGMLNFNKQLNPEFRTVPHFLSGRAFLQPGFAGTTLCVDPLNKVSSFAAGNRLHNRVYTFPESVRSNVTTLKDGERIYENGEIKKLVSSTYRDEVEAVTQKAMILSIQYKLLEKLKGLEKETALVRHI